MERCSAEIGDHMENKDMDPLAAARRRIPRGSPLVLCVMKDWQFKLVPEFKEQTYRFRSFI